MRHYEIMIILDPNLEERTVQPSLEGFLKVVTDDGGRVGKLDIWGKRRLSYPIALPEVVPTRTTPVRRSVRSLA
jgi:small subunit ribosomal protein S6